MASTFETDALAFFDTDLFGEFGQSVEYHRHGLGPRPITAIVRRGQVLFPIAFSDGHLQQDEALIAVKKSDVPVAVPDKEQIEVSDTERYDVIAVERDVLDNWMVLRCRDVGRKTFHKEGHLLDHGIS